MKNSLFPETLGATDFVTACDQESGMERGEEDALEGKVTFYLGSFYSPHHRIHSWILTSASWRLQSSCLGTPTIQRAALDLEEGGLVKVSYKPRPLQT